MFGVCVCVFSDSEKLTVRIQFILHSYIHAGYFLLCLYTMKKIRYAVVKVFFVTINYFEGFQEI